MNCTNCNHELDYHMGEYFHSLSEGITLPKQHSICAMRVKKVYNWYLCGCTVVSTERLKNE